MAAGAYKGLTIRIGADTTRLASALRGVNSVIFKTQGQLTKLTKSLKIDPGNTGVMARQLGAASDMASSLASKMDNLRQGMAKLGTTAMKGDASKNIGELARETDNVALAAERALEKYNDLNAELNQKYKPIEEATGINLHESENISPEQWDKDLTLVRQFGAITAEQEIEIRKLHDSWTDARNAMEDYQNAADLDRMKNDLSATDAQLNAMARTYAKLSMKTDLSKSFSGVDNQLRVMNSAAESASTRFERLNRSAELHPGSISLAVERVKALSAATEIAQSKAELLKQKIAAYKADGVEKIAKGIENIPKAFAESEEAIAQAKRELDDYRQRADATEDEIRRLERALEDAERAGREVAKVQEWQELEDELREVGDEAERMQKALSGSDMGIGTAAVTAAVAIGDMMRDVGGKVVDSSDAIDKSYRDLRKTFDAEEADYKKLYDAAMQYSQTHVTSADTMLEMEAIAAQLGVGLDGGADAIQHFSEVAANLDVATDIDAETIALQMGQIVNVMDDLRPDNVERFGDALVKLGNNMPTQESNIMQISQRLSSVGNVAGFSTPEILGWAAAIASTGQRSEAAATGISNTITAIQSAVSRGGDDLQAFADVAGVSAEEFADKWRTGPSDALKLFIDGLKNAKEEAIVKLEDVGIEGVRQTQTLLGLAQTSERVTQSIGMATTAFGDEAAGIASTGDAAEEANKKAEGFSGSLQKMKNSAQVLAAQFGDAMVPFIQLATSGLQLLSSILDKLGPGFKTFAVGVGGVFSAVAVGYPIVSNIMKPVGDLFTRLKKFGALKIGQFIAKFDGVGGVMAGIKTAIAGLGTAAGVTAGALGALAIMVGGYYIKKWMDAKKHSEDFIKTIGDIRDTTDGLHQDLLFGTDTVDGYAEAWSAAGPNMDDFFQSMQEHASAMQQTRDDAATNVAMLEKYRDILDRAAGAGDDSAVSMGELQWALDGLAEITGEVYSAEDILSGTFEGEAGNADKLREALHKLIDAKKKESQLDAITAMRTEAVKGQMEASDAIKEAADAYKNYFDIIKEGHGFKSDKETQAYIDANPQRHDVEHLMGLKSAWDESQAVYDEWGNKIETLDRQYDGLYDDMAYASSAAYGEREGIMQTSRVMKQALDAVGMTDEGIKQLASSIQDAGISTEEFKNIGSEAFSAMVKQSGGDIQTITDMLASFNEMGLSDKTLGIHVEDGELVDANRQVIEWNGQEWVYKETGVRVDTTSIDEAEQKIDNMKGDVETKFTANADEVKQTTDQVNSMDGGEVETTFTANDEDVKQTAEQVDNMDGGEVETTFTANDEDVQQTVDQVNTLDGGEVVTTFTANTEGIDAAVNALNNLQGKDIVVNIVTGNTSGVDAVNGLLASVPTSVQTLITVTTNGVLNAIERIGALNTVAGKMQNVTRTYTANGNATGKTPSNNISSLNSAASNMSDHTASYTANGNAASGAAARNVWDLVNAVSHMQNKTVTLTTEHVTVNKTVQSGGGGAFATGTYIDPNKMPKHAAGIFTRPTLTNIGWVGEDGAELYSGNSLVPLTNRKYSMPYIDDISSAVAKKLGTQSTGIDYELLGRSVATALAGMSVTIDGQALVGEIATQVERTSRFYAG